MKNRIAAIRESKGISQTALADLLGIHVTNLNKIERDKSNPGMDRFQQIADVLEVPLRDVFEEDQAGGFEEEQASFSTPQQAGLPFAGVVAAGVFRRVDLQDDTAPKVVAIMPDPRYGHAKQYVWRVEGDSMDRAGLRDGMYAVGVDYFDLVKHYRDIQQGDIVIVERLRFDGQERELTAKRFWKEPGGFALVPDSSNDKHKAIFVPKDDKVIGETIRIIAYVTGAYTLFGKAEYDLDEGEFRPIR